MNCVHLRGKVNTDKNRKKQSDPLWLKSAFGYCDYHKVIKTETDILNHQKAKNVVETRPINNKFGKKPKKNNIRQSIQNWLNTT